MTNITWLLIGIIVGIIIGVFLGGYIVKLFNVTDYSISGKYKAKNGSNMDLTNILNTKPKEKLIKRLFKRKNK